VIAASATLDANVTIESISEIIVYPNTLNWTSVSLGAPGGVKSITVENTGSENVTQLYVYPDTLSDEAIRPYGNDSSDAYATGGVLVIQNETDPFYYFAGRLEWNWSTSISALNTSLLTSPVSWGFFKNNSIEYVWAVGNGTDGLCNNTEAQFAIDDDVDSGDMTTRTPDPTSITPDFSDADYAYFSVDRAGAPLEGYCVAVNATCEKVYIYKFDKRTGFTQCGNSGFVTQNDMTPGNKTQLNLDVFIPHGIPSGELSRATVTFVVT
jgi:hypothetical protein